MKIIVSSDRRCTSISTIIISVLGLTGLSWEILKVIRTVLKPVPRELPASGKDLPHTNDKEGQGRICPRRAATLRDRSARALTDDGFLWFRKSKWSLCETKM